MAVTPEPSSRLVSASAALRSRGWTSNASTTSVSVRGRSGGSMGSVRGRSTSSGRPMMGHRDRSRRRRIAPPQRARSRLSSRRHVRATRVSPAPVPPRRRGDWVAGSRAAATSAATRVSQDPVPLPTPGVTGDSAASPPPGDESSAAPENSLRASSRPCLISVPNQAPGPDSGSSAPRRRAGPDGVAGRGAPLTWRLGGRISKEHDDAQDHETPSAHANKFT